MKKMKWELWTGGKGNSILEIRALSGRELKDFERNLRETIAWCQWKVAQDDPPLVDDPPQTPDWCRTPELNSRQKKIKEDKIFEVLNKTASDVRTVCSKRRTLLAQKKQRAYSGPLSQAKGRLLVDRKSVG